MKAISLWQPWASFIAAGSKRVETRSWATKYRGPLLIHAAKRLRLMELIHESSCWNNLGAMDSLIPRHSRASWSKTLPFGAIVASCELVDCRPTDIFTNAELDTKRFPAGESSALYCWTERQMGDFTLGRFGWILENVRPLPKPIPFRGKQQLFDVPDSLLKIREASA